MSFLKYGLISLVGRVGQLIFVVGLLFLFGVVSSEATVATTERVGLAIGILLFGVVLTRYARFRRKTIIVERGVKDGQKRIEEESTEQ